VFNTKKAKEAYSLALLISEREDILWMHKLTALNPRSFISRKAVTAAQAANKVSFEEDLKTLTSALKSHQGNLLERSREEEALSNWNKIPDGFHFI